MCIIIIMGIVDKYIYIQKCNKVLDIVAQKQVRKICLFSAMVALKNVPAF